MPELVAEVEIVAPIGRVFDAVTTPARWPQFWDITLGVEGDVTEPGRVGEHFVEQVKLRTWRGEFHWEVVVAGPPTRYAIRGRSHTDGRLGRLMPSEAVEIRYDLVGTPAGTRWRRVMEYPSPPLLLWPLDVVVMRPQLRRAIARAMARVKAALDADP